MVKRVILEGCNGEWARMHYLPVLVKKAVQGDIDLWAIDINDSVMFNNDEFGVLERDWQSGIKLNTVHYLNKKKDKKICDELSNACYVFVVVPDRFHQKITRYWLDRLKIGGKIFIEKPLAGSISSAQILRKEIENKGKKGSVFGFDHYLARTYPVGKTMSSYLSKSSGIRKVEFELLESSSISKSREDTLKKGIIFDLFCHCLALICSCKDINFACSVDTLKKIKLVQVKAAQYIGSPISKETFALIDFGIKHDIKVRSVIGKCVGDSDSKYMKVWGTDHNTELNYVDDTYSIINLTNGQELQGKLDNNHVESFLEGILNGKEPFLVPGVLSFDSAFEILKLLEKIQRKLNDKLHEYECGDSLDKILEIIEEGK